MDALDPAKGTCKWIERHETFIDWFNSSSVLLWIRGKPGSGKSMAMKHLFLMMEAQRRRDEIVISFFFHGQGVDLQKTRLGLYRSLLHQLYGHLPEIFIDVTKKFEEYTKNTNQVSWMAGEMQQFFLASLPEACKRRSIVLLVDALDEAGEDEARKLVGDLTTIMDSSQQPESALRVCFSCRHYPEVDLKGGKTLVMEEANGSDIEAVVAQILRNPTKLSDTEKNRVKSEILENSNGVFQWATLALKNALQGKLDGDSLATTRGLRDVPEGLHSLYKSLLQIPDGRNQQHRARQRLRLFEWLWLSLRPLSPRELQHALAFDYESDYTSISEYTHGSDFILEENLESSIKSLSRGLAHVEGTFDEGRVEFIHQSVMDFLGDGGMQFLLNPSSEHPVAFAHFKLSRFCLKYFSMYELGSEFHRFACDSPYLLSNSMYGIRSEWLEKYPLLSYAWRHWVFHACRRQDIHAREGKDANDLDLLRFFHWPDEKNIIAAWVAIRRVLGHPLEEWWKSMGRTLGPAYKSGWGYPVGSFSFALHWPNPGSGMIHFFAVCGLNSALHHIISSEKALWFSHRSLKMSDARGFMPLYYSVAGQQIQTLRILLAAGASVNDPKPSNIKWIKTLGSSKIEYWDDESLLYTASLWGDPEAITLLIKHGENHHTKEDLRGETMLHIAAKEGHPSTGVKALIGAGADVNARQCYGKTPLHFAAKVYSREDRHQLRAPTITCLVEHGADLNALDDQNRTPLYDALMAHNLQAVKLLLTLGCDLNVLGPHGETALQLSARIGQSEAVEVLLKAGATLSAMRLPVLQNFLRGPGLKPCEFKVIGLMLQSGCCANMPGSWQTALESAVDKQDMKQAKELIDNIPWR